MNFDRGMKKLQEQFNENPMQTIAIGGMAAAGLGRLIKAIADIQRSHTWKREVDRRRYNDRARAPRRRY